VQLKGFLSTGHTPSLVCAFLYFDISFMIWVILGALANAIVPDLQMTDAQRGWMIAIPALGGSILRLVLGPLADYMGPKKTGLLGMVLTVIPLLLGWLWADSYEKVLVVGFLLGVAGASFAVALPMASRWYPPQYQGLALGIAGAGNSGTALATLFVPLLVVGLGNWHDVFAVAAIPLGIVFFLFLFFAKDAPNQPKPKTLKDYTSVLHQKDTWLFCFLYTITFGGFVGFCLFLNSFFRVQFEVDPKVAGYLATACVISGSFLRPVGGYLSDRFGGVRMLLLLFVGVGISMSLLSLSLSLYLTLAVLFLGMGMLGMGNGAVFQLVPLRFPKEIGVLTGIVGAAGGIGGFLLNIQLGYFKEWSGSYSTGFLLFGLISFVAAGLIAYLGSQWIPQPNQAPLVETSPTIVSAESPA
jgi:MFS transporter, NNP family, nitrate/nitrite transporter